MNVKTYIPDGEKAPASQIGATLDALMATIEARRDAGEGSYTYRLLSGKLDTPLKKVMEEAGEVALAAKDAEAAAAGASADAQVDHLRYEAADVVYHLLVVLARFGIGIDEFAAELNNRMRADERPEGAIRLRDDHVQRGK
jgi:phosphoribosyl-ATP pyrophosphohydrolase/phosphoribosyl-ATP pyrophosphohydrolase/phosphoribosyl-AMP cyclohydrolase